MNWRFDAGSERHRESSGGYRDRGDRDRRRSPRRRSPSPRRGRDRNYSPKRDDRRSERDYDRRDRGGDRSRSPEDRCATLPNMLLQAVQNGLIVSQRYEGRQG